MSTVFKQLTQRVEHHLSVIYAGVELQQSIEEVAQKLKLRIKVKSEKEKGTTFEVIIPAKKK